jgi:hypothetical protein
VRGGGERKEGREGRKRGRKEKRKRGRKRKRKEGREEGRKDRQGKAKEGRVERGSRELQFGIFEFRPEVAVQKVVHLREEGRRKGGEGGEEEEQGITRLLNGKMM